MTYRILSNTVQAFTDTSADSGDLGVTGGAGFVLLTPTQTCHVAFRKKGVTTAATTSDFPLLTANVAHGPFKFNHLDHIAVIRAGASNGNLHITVVDVYDID